MRGGLFADIACYSQNRNDFPKLWAQELAISRASRAHIENSGGRTPYKLKQALRSSVRTFVWPASCGSEGKSACSECCLGTCASQGQSPLSYHAIKSSGNMYFHNVIKALYDQLPVVSLLQKAVWNDSRSSPNALDGNMKPCLPRWSLSNTCRGLLERRAPTDQGMYTLERS